MHETILFALPFLAYRMQLGQMRIWQQTASASSVWHVEKMTSM